MKLKKRIFSFVLIGSIAGVSPLQALAATSSEIQDQIESYMADLDASQRKSEELQEEISSRQEAVSDLYAEVASLSIEKDLYYEEMKTRIAYFYEEMQGNSLLGALFCSDNFAEFISRIQFQQALYDYDAERMEEYQELLEDLEIKQSVLDEEINDLGDMVEEEAVLQAALDAAISVKQTELEEVKAEEAAAAAAAAAQKAAEEEAARRAATDAAVYALSSSSSDTASLSADGTASSASESTAAEASYASGSSESGSSASAASYEPSVSSAEDSYAEESSYTEETPAAATESASSSYTSSGGDGVLTKSKGVNYYNGKMETWYTQRILPGEGLNIPGRYVDSRGIVCDGDGYICVASDDYPRGTVIETSLGAAKVYDCGPGSGIVDIYTDW